MDYITDLKKKLECYAGFDLFINGDELTVKCHNEDSFSVRIFDWGDAYQVEYGGWIEEFKDVEDALNCFAFAFTDECRLKVVKWGETETKWTLQSFVDGVWQDDTTIGRLIVPFWRDSEITYQQNKLIKKP